MGKLKHTILVKKKDYILKPLPLQKGLSHNETMEYINIHLPSLYPGDIEPGQLGYAQAGEQLLVFILHHPMKKRDRDRAVVPFLLLNGKQEGIKEGTCIISYRDGYEKIGFKSGAVPTIDWIDTPTSSGDTPPQSLEDSDSNSSSYPRQIYLEQDDTPVWKIFHTGKSNVARATPFSHPPVLSKAKGLRMATALGVCIIMLLLIYLRSSDARNSYIEVLENRLNDLTKRTYTLTSQEKISAGIITRWKELNDYELYAPYAFLTEIYDVVRESGSYTTITSVRLSKTEFALEGYTTSSLQLLDAFNKAGLFKDIELSAVHSASDDTKKPLSSMAGFRISGSHKQDLSDNEQEEPRA